VGVETILVSNSDCHSWLDRRQVASFEEGSQHLEEVQVVGGIVTPLESDRI
jgi:hypothetical protein